MSRNSIEGSFSTEGERETSFSLPLLVVIRFQRCFTKVARSFSFLSIVNSNYTCCPLYQLLWLSVPGTEMRGDCYWPVRVALWSVSLITGFSHYHQFLCIGIAR